jgi:hypothetical protein
MFLGEIATSAGHCCVGRGFTQLQGKLVRFSEKSWVFMGFQCGFHGISWDSMWISRGFHVENMGEIMVNH